MRRLLTVFGVGLLLAVALLGCAKQQESATETTTDSLLATNPIEQPQGDLTPQEQFEPEPPPVEPPVETPRAKTPAPRPRAKTPAPTPTPQETGVTLAAGTPIEVAVTTQITSETAQVGDTWTGEVKENVIVGSTVVIPAGSIVHGVVNESLAAAKGSRAKLGLAVKGITVGGKEHMVSAGTEAIEAGSTRARNLGAVAGGAAAGALIGKAVGGSGKGAVIGGLIGGAAAGAGVAASKGFQVTIKEGTVITFSVNENVVVRS